MEALPVSMVAREEDSMSADMSKAMAPSTRALIAAGGVAGPHTPNTSHPRECDFCIRIARALDAFAASEQAELLAALRDVLDNGLIYWEPNTSRGSLNKSLMIERCRAALAKAEEQK